MYIKRNLTEAFSAANYYFPVLLLTGPRQVGKSTFLTHIAEPNRKYITLDDINLKMQAQEDPQLFLRNNPPPVIIDEIQYAPALLSYIKMDVDNTNEKGKYWLTGSQRFELMKNVSESLSGRVGVFDLFAFSNREINGFKEEQFIPDINLLKKKEPLKRLSVNKIFENILRGSYPDVRLDKEMIVEHYYSSYIRTYIERDVRELIKVKDENKFVKFITTLAARTSGEFNANEISSDVGIDNKTVEEWLSILKNTGIIYLLQSYTNNNVSRAIRRPKIYFMDTGLACYLTGYTNAEILEKSSYSGAIFETFIVSEIIKSYTNNGIDPRRHLYFYRDSSGKEIDLLVTVNNYVYPVEIKKSSNPGNKSIKNFDVVSKFGMNVGNGIVLCLCKEILAIDDNNYYVPIEYV